LSYTPEKGDNFVVTYPKSGTTWTQLIIKLIINEGFNDENNTTFMRNSFLEFSGEDVIKYPIIKTHLPFHSLPYNTNANYLCVFHNLKDVSVSYFYHTLQTDPQFKGDFHEFFKYWIDGQTPYGDYFTHTLDYWCHRFDDNFQHLVYEEMKSKPKESVLKIAKFLGKDLSTN